MVHSEPQCLDYFSGGVPPLLTIDGILDDLSRTIDRESTGISRINELCLIGLVSYSEAFFKDQFAAILNIEPTLVNGLMKAGYDALIDPVALLAYQDYWGSKLGFLIAEKHDFGTWKKVNGLFNATLGISPFSKDDANKFDSLLRDRNLLVHHGGVFTTKYLEQKKIPDQNGVAHTPFFGSLVVTASYLDEQLAFVGELTAKTATQACKRLKQIDEVKLSNSEQKKHAIEAFVWKMSEESFDETIDD
jgi:hypothetical protein